MAEQRREGGVATAPPPETRPARPWAARLAERFPVRRVILWVLAVLIVFGVVTGSWKTFQLPVSQGGVSGTGWRALVANGIAQGSIYALIALGYSLVYGILLMINFAHGEVFMSGAFASYFVASSLDSKGLLARDPIPSVLLLMLTAILVSMGVAVLLERVAYRPLRNAPRLVPLITAIGASLFLQYTFAGFFGSDAKGYPDVKVLTGNLNLVGFPIAKTQVLTIVVAIVMMVALTLFIAKTRTGRAMRAVAEDKEIASLMGIDINRVVVTTFAIGGALAGIAGVLFALVFGEVDSFMGFVPGIKAFTAAVLGGIGSVTGAAIGGLILGVVESVGPQLLLIGIHVPGTNQLRDVVAFSILVIVLVFRPGGILGTGEHEKA
jgi:branched-chain amino acid transport system permease protein